MRKICDFFFREYIFTTQILGGKTGWSGVDSCSQPELSPVPEASFLTHRDLYDVLITYVNTSYSKHLRKKEGILKIL